MSEPLIQTICLIDDDQVLQFIFKRIIKLYNIAQRTLVFSDGSEAYDFCREVKTFDKELPDLVFLDLNMPQMDGWDFLDEYIKIKSVLPKQPVIYIMSSSTHPNDKERAAAYEEIAGYIVKPVDEEKILQIVKEAFPQES